MNTRTDIKAYETRIVKISKGEFYVEYKETRWGDWKMVAKPFKTSTKAKGYIIKNLK